MVRPRVDDPRAKVTSLRLSESEKTEMERASKILGYRSVGDYLRHLHDASVSMMQEVLKNPIEKSYGTLNIAHATEFGKIFRGNSLQYLHHEAEENSVNLIVTSPPFGLISKKSYGNEDAVAYLNWFRPFAAGFKKVLRDDGSLVIDIGGSWKEGTPTRSLYHFKLLTMLCEEYGFHLAQEHFWWNPSKLPSPAEWVNIRRVRVKDAVNCVWWLSKTPYPKANNRRILAPYSDSMNKLLEKGCRAQKRPSGHDISENFNRDNGGAVPPNLLAIANTESQSDYQEFCRVNGLPIHPARFPAQLPEYFIKFLTDPGDLVIDPFGGSCVTGMVAESMKRRWACIELDDKYIAGAISRFNTSGDSPKKLNRQASYSINSPCYLPIDEQSVPLILDGGLKKK